MENIKNISTYELIREIEKRDEIAALIVWQREDIEEALKNAGYNPTEERIDKVISMHKGFEECCIEDGWERWKYIVRDCEFGEQDMEK